MRRGASAVFLLVALAGCGFQLRGAAGLPFESIYIPGNSGIALDLKRNIAAGTRTRVTDERKSAQAVLEFQQEVRQKDILSLTAAGRVREFRLKYLVGFRVHDGKGGEFVPASALELSREVTYSDTDVLAKEAEEQLLYRDMQNDMVQLIMRRLAAAPARKPAARE